MQPYEMKTVLKDMSWFANFLRGEVYAKHEPLNIEIAVTEEPIPFDERKELEYRKYEIGDKWSNKLFNCGWMHLTGTVQPNREHAESVLMIDVSGEGCLFDKDGTPVRGLTNVASQFERKFGLPGKTTLFLDEIDTDGGEIDVWVELGDNDLFGMSFGGVINMCHTGYLYNERRALFYDFSFLLSYLNGIDDKNPQYYAILSCMEKAAAKVSSSYKSDEIAKAREILKTELDRKNADHTFLTFYAIGHAHLDLAWLWPIRETKRKLGRTFANAIANMDKYPDFMFGASQAQQFDWLEQLYPKLFEKVQRRVDEGRLEIQGGMWVEADTNVSGGEALVRQMLYGKRYFKEKFNQDIKVCWLPDAFGFTGALPQILKKCGIDYFLTIKLSWNEHFTFPHHTFIWEGIDGSKVLVHMPPEGNYNSPASPELLLEAQGNFAERGVIDKAVVLYGIGDGGGGPGRDHIERVARAKNFYGLPKVKQEKSSKFFSELSDDKDKLSVWKGEMYLDRHQGTLSSAAQNKKYNRRLENLLSKAEKISVIAANRGVKYPREILERIWKEVLLYQFHDILPGSSIKRVYDESVPRYKAMEAQVLSLIEEAEKSMQGGLAVFNDCSFARDEIVEHGGKCYKVNALPLCYTAIEPINEVKSFKVKSEKGVMENEFIKAYISPNGEITDIIDKSTNQNALNCGNTLKIYNEFFDCWDMTASFKKYYVCTLKPIYTKSYVKANCAVTELRFEYNDSQINQKIILKDGERFLRIKNEVVWRETKKLLRVEFDPVIKSDKAVCDIQFGCIERPTYSSTVEQFGKYEVSMHKYVDISDRCGGVAVFNDSKYACNVKDGFISLNLLRSQMYPCTDCDKGEQDFEYAVYPHAGDSYSSDAHLQSYAFNKPLTVCNVKPCLPILQINDNSVIADTVKKCEDGDGIVVRLYESKNSRVDVGLTFGGEYKIFECDMLENELNELTLTNGELRLSFTPFEIKTLKLKQK